ncbi:MAG: hypothetical protein JO356_10815 [Acidobacteria bacterium]|nr:hypothetical protein [Acidobacteriota bacterium]
MSGRPSFAMIGALLFQLGTASPVKAQADAVLQWNSVALQASRDSNLGVPMQVRALAIVSTCLYDAWAAYDDRAISTQLAGALRRPAFERTLANKEKAISYAAYRALTDVLPADAGSVYKPLMTQLGYDPNDNSTDIETPAGIGTVACDAVLEFRHHDKSNQLGDLSQGPYSDWTHFRPVNMPTPVALRFPTIHPINPNHWQPLLYVNSTGDFVTQMFVGAQWCFVRPFALSNGDEFRGLAKTLPPAVYGSTEYRAQAEELVSLSANLNDRQKMLVEYWSAGSDSEQAPGNWNLFAEWVAARRLGVSKHQVALSFVIESSR